MRGHKIHFNKKIISELSLKKKKVIWSCVERAVVNLVNLEVFAHANVH